MITVALQAADSSGCGYWRCWGPLLNLQARGEIKIIANHLSDGPRGPQLNRVGHLPFDVICALGRMGKFVLTLEAAHAADVIIIQRQMEVDKPSPGQMSLTATIREQAAKTVYDLDDNMWQITRDNPAYFEEVARHGGRGYASMRELMKLSRVVTATTPALADVFRKINPEVRVVPNGIDLDWWGTDAPRANRADWRIRVLYVASRNHRSDVPMLIKPFKAIAAKYPHVTFVLAGTFDAELKRALGDRLEVHNDGVQVSDYPAMCRALDGDICVAPLSGTVFDQGKSNLKWLEGTALRCPVVCSAVTPYLQDVGPMVVRNAADWVSALSDLINDADLREACVRQSLETVRAKYTMQHSADALLDVLREVVSP